MQDIIKHCVEENICYDCGKKMDKYPGIGFTDTGEKCPLCHTCIDKLTKNGYGVSLEGHN